MTTTPPAQPAAASAADAGDVTLPFSAAAERNAPPILQVLQAWLPAQARVLEIASGTGQHAAHFARAQPGWHWQPSEAQPDALPVLVARTQGLGNVAPPLQLDVLALQAAQHQPARPGARGADAAAGVPGLAGPVDAVYVANLLHIAPWPATAAFFGLAARCLVPDGQVLVYGPFEVEGEALAPSNAAFDADLRQRDPRWGLRSLQAVRQAAAAAGLQWVGREAMPANNLMLRFRLIGAGMAATQTT